MSTIAARMRDIAALISRTESLVRERGRREAAYRRATLILLGLMAAVALDAVFPLPDAVRAIITGAAVATLVYYLVQRRKRRPHPPSVEHLARLLEESQPSLDNALINAVQFEQQVEATPESLTRELMAREISRAAGSAAQVNPEVAVDPRALLLAKRRLLAVAILFALSLVLLPRVYLAVVPRYVLPFLDFPPFSLTRFYVDPRGAQVSYGESLTITVRTAGAPAHGLSLMTSADGKQWEGLPLFQTGTDEYVQKLEHLQTNLLYYLRAESGRTRRYRIEVNAAPQVRSIEVAYRYPAYTNSPPVSEKLGTEGIKGVAGTTVTLRVNANRPLSEGRLRILQEKDQTPIAVPLVPDRATDSSTLAQFTIRRSGRFAVDLVGDDGLSTSDAAEGRITLVKDEHPLVYISTPGRPSLATPNVKVPITVEAEDSFGLRSLRLHRSLNESQDVPLDFTLPDSHPREAVWRLQLDMADLGVQPGDIIDYHATAYDTDPQRRNYSDSEQLWIQVISEEQYRDLLRAQTKVSDLVAKYRDLIEEMKELQKQQQELADRTRQLKDELAKSPDAAKQAQLKQLAEDQQRLAQQAADLAQRMKQVAQEKPLFDIEKDLKQRLGQLAEGMSQAAQSMGSAGSSLERASKAPQPAPDLNRASQSQQQALQQLGKLGKQAAPMEKVLKDLEKVYPLFEDAAKVQAATEAQGNLVLKAKELEGITHPTPEQQSRMDDLALDQAKIKDYLKKTVRDMHAHAQQLRESYPDIAEKGEQLASTLERLPIDQHMGNARDAFRKHDGDRGLKEAQTAFDLLKGQRGGSGNCQNAAQKGLSGTCSGQGMSLGDTLNQLASACKNPGQNQGRGSGTGRGTGTGAGGVGGSMGSELPGMSSPDLNLYGPQTPQGSRSSPSGRTQQTKKLPPGQRPDYLAPTQVEVLGRESGRPNDQAGGEEERFPAEYKALVRDYFKRVSEDAARAER